MPKSKRPSKPQQAESYQHSDAKSLMRPDVGTQAQFKKKKPPKTYRYDSSLSPELNWDGQNPAREQGEALIARLADASARLARLQEKLSGKIQEDQLKKLQEEIGKLQSEIQSATDALKALSRPFLNWAGKAERLSFDVPTLPLFVHERLSTKAIIETLAGHKRDTQLSLMELFGDPQHSITDQVLRAYEYQDQWTNRMILGDSLVVMNSLVHYEELGGQIQMIYMDPPYGVKFGSNFQPFVRKRDVSHNDDQDMTREPEMVQAYRDTWEVGLHSYLAYLRDRLILARELLTPSGSIFVQISDENLHHVREVMDEVFGKENFVTTIIFQKTSSEDTEGLANTADYIIWFCKDRTRFKYNPLYRLKRPGEPGAKQYVYARSHDSAVIRKMTAEEIANPELLPPGWKVCRRGFPLTSQHYSETRTVEFNFDGKPYHPGLNRQWSVSPETGLPGLVEKRRIYTTGRSLNVLMDLDDMPGTEFGNVWTDTGTGSFTDEQIYVVQTSEKVVQRCMLMTTQPGDLVLDPTCGSGTTAYVAERWGRRWITIDTSRVPLALARQRVLTATFPWYKLKDESRGPSGGFDFRKQNTSGNRKADGYGIALQHTLSSIAGDEPPKEIVLLENPERDYAITRIAGSFCVEATIPTPVDWEGDGIEDSGVGAALRGRPGEGEHIGSPLQNHVDRMLEVLRKSPVLRLEGNKTVTFKNVRPPAKTLSLSAEALVVNGGEKAVALVFGPENGAVSEKLVYEAAREAHAKNYTHLYVIGFAIQPNARMLVEKSAEVVGVPATYVQATPDLLMGDLLKNMRSSQIFSVCGLPEIQVHRTKDKKYQVELLGYDVFEPVSMEVDHRPGGDVPAWFLDTDYNDLCFHVTQAFFPRTGAWDNLKKALKGEYQESVWEHLSGTVSAPFEAGEHRQVAVKVIDDRGNELLVIKKLGEAKS